MRLKFYFIACLVALNGLFIGYAVGFNSRHVLIIDPKLPPYVKPVTVEKSRSELKPIEEKKLPGNKVLPAPAKAKAGEHLPASGKATAHQTSGAKEGGSSSSKSANVDKSHKSVSQHSSGVAEKGGKSTSTSAGHGDGSTAKGVAHGAHSASERPSPGNTEKKPAGAKN